MTAAPSLRRHSRRFCRSPPDPEVAGVSSPNACGKTRQGAIRPDGVLPPHRQKRIARTASSGATGLQARHDSDGTAAPAAAACRRLLTRAGSHELVVTVRASRSQRPCLAGAAAFVVQELPGYETAVRKPNATNGASGALRLTSARSTGASGRRFSCSFAHPDEAPGSRPADGESRVSKPRAVRPRIPLARVFAVVLARQRVGHPQVWGGRPSS